MIFTKPYTFQFNYLKKTNYFNYKQLFVFYICNPFIKDFLKSLIINQFNLIMPNPQEPLDKDHQINAQQEKAESNQYFGEQSPYRLRENHNQQPDQLQTQQAQKSKVENVLEGETYTQNNQNKQNQQIAKQQQTCCQKNCSTCKDIVLFPFRLLLSILVLILMLPCILIILIIIFISFICVVWGTASKFIAEKCDQGKICIAILCILTFPISCFVIFCLQAGQACKSINTNYGLPNNNIFNSIW